MQMHTRTQENMLHAFEGHDYYGNIWSCSNIFWNFTFPLLDGSSYRSHKTIANCYQCWTGYFVVIGQYWVTRVAPSVTRESRLVNLLHTLWRHYSVNDIKVPVAAKLFRIDTALIYAWSAILCQTTRSAISFPREPIQGHWPAIFLVVKRTTI